MNRSIPVHRALFPLAFAIAALHGPAAQAEPACSGYGFVRAPGSFGGGPGAGGFSSVNVGSAPITATVGDFNGDRFPDIATANRSSNNVTILLGNANGDGNFTQAAGSPVATGGNAPWGIASGLFNSDEHLDLVVSHVLSTNVTVLLGNGVGGFNALQPVSVGPGQADTQRIATADFNGDGRLDVAVANKGFNAAPASVSVLLGDGTGAFNQAPGSPLSVPGLSSATDVVAGRFAGGDAVVDLAVTSQGTDSLLVLQGTGNGGFELAQSLVTVPAPDAAPITVDAQDIDGDGLQDLLVANGVNRANGGVAPSPANRVAIFRALPAGGLASTPTFVEAGADLSSATAADMDLDGRPDVVVSNAAFQFSGSVALQEGTGFAPSSAHPAAGNPFDVVVADFNDDGVNDFAVVNQSSDTLTVYLNTCRPIEVFANGFEP